MGGGELNFSHKPLPQPWAGISLFPLLKLISLPWFSPDDAALLFLGPSVFSLLHEIPRKPRDLRSVRCGFPERRVPKSRQRVDS